MGLFKKVFIPQECVVCKIVFERLRNLTRSIRCSSCQKVRRKELGSKGAKVKAKTDAYKMVQKAWRSSPSGRASRKASKVKYVSSLYGRESERRRARIRRESNPDSLRASKRRHYLKNRDHILNRVFVYSKGAGKLKIRARSVSLAGRFSSYKGNAKTKGREFSITFEEFVSFAGRPCFYCSEILDSPRMDRLNSDVGYVLANLVPCCWPCNRMKGSLTYDEFTEKCVLIVRGLNVNKKFTEGLRG